MTAKWVAVLVLAGFSVSGWGQTHVKSFSQYRFAITAQEVAQTLSDRGVRVENQQVTLLARVVATDPHPVLDVIRVEPVGGRPAKGNTEARSLVKLACHMPGTCLPFFAMVNFQDEVVEAAPGVSRVSLAPKERLKSLAPIAIRAGAHATLVIDDGRSHIEMSVISLESGNVGSRIRAASPDHKQIYIAEVVSANMLKRSF
jgi:hypothetical protein